MKNSNLPETDLLQQFQSDVKIPCKIICFMGIGPQHNNFPTQFFISFQYFGIWMRIPKSIPNIKRFRISSRISANSL